MRNLFLVLFTLFSLTVFSQNVQIGTLNDFDNALSQEQKSKVVNSLRVFKQETGKDYTVIVSRTSFNKTLNDVSNICLNIFMSGERGKSHVEFHNTYFEKSDNSFLFENIFRPNVRNGLDNAILMSVEKQEKY